MQTQIVYEDEAVIVIRKPAGLATESAGVGQKDVVSELKNYLAKKSGGKVPYLGVVHRLDQPVEGLLTFAKTKKAAENLTAQLCKGTLKKEYLAVVCGKVPEKSGRLVDYLAKEKGMATVKAAGDPQAKQAVLTFEKKAQTEDSTLLSVCIDTGRFHQIRIQLSHAGFPLLGDEKYGSEESKELSREKKIRFTALCAASLSFRHPVTGKAMVFTQAPQNPAFEDFAAEE